MILSWRHSAIWIIVLLAGSIALFTTLDNGTALLLCLLAYMGVKAGIAWLTIQRGGWRRPAGLFIVAYSISWSAFVGYNVAESLGGGALPEHLLDLLYAAMFTSAALSMLTFPWIEEVPQERDDIARISEQLTTISEEARSAVKDAATEAVASSDERTRVLLDDTAKQATLLEVKTIVSVPIDEQPHDEDPSHEH